MQIMFSCGHEGEIKVSGPKANRERQIWKAEHYDLCDKCAAEARAKAHEEALKYANENDLPTLLGSIKQVEWAERIRMRLLALVTNEITSQMDGSICKWPDNKEKQDEYISTIMVLREIMSEIRSANWWIENRDSKPNTLIYSMKSKINTRITAEATEEPIEQEVIDEVILRPSDMRYGVAKVIAQGDKILAIYERNDAFRETLKKLKYYWSAADGAWMRKITEMTGSITDRAAELVNALLQTGFAVVCMDDAVREKAIQADYEAECERWIYHKGNNQLGVTFPRDSTLNNILRKCGGVWNRDSHAYLVDASNEKDLDELVRLYGFRYTAQAKEALTQYHKQISKAITVDVAVKPKPHDETVADPLKEILNSSREILSDLRDD